MKISSENAIVENSNYTSSTATIHTGKTSTKEAEPSQINISEMTDEDGQPTEQAYQTAVNKLNEFMEYNQKNTKFVFHTDLERYYVEIVDAQTQEVVKEIPPKKLLDAYYEMQKVAGRIFDSQA